MAKLSGVSVQRVLLLSGLMSAGAVSGCAYGELTQVLRAQVASETRCSDLTVESSPMYQPGYKAGQYLVKGCGVDRTYECPEQKGLVSYSAKVCTFVDTHAAKLPEAQPMGDEPPLDEAGAPATEN